MSTFFATINFGLVVLIWLVQLIIYPGMRGWQRTSFVELHNAYTRRMSLVVGPLMLAQAGLALGMVFGSSGGKAVIQVLLVAGVWLVTISCSIPMHRRLLHGYDERAVDHLIATNWLRTAGWSLISLLDWV